MLDQEINITQAESGTRIDKICAARFPDVSRSQWQNYGIFKKGNQEFSEKTKAKFNQIWSVSYAPNNFSEKLKPWDTPLKIVHDSASWLVLNKPIGVSVHPSPSEKSNQTIVNALVHHFGIENLAESSDQIDGQTVLRPGIVHRLDKVTSGLLIIAKTNQTQAYFQEVWAEKVQKFYEAMVIGETPAAGKIQSDIARDAEDRQKMKAVAAGFGKDSLTTFKTIEIKDHRSLVEAELHTGRTHQIRTHLSSIGFPIIGDELYGGKKSTRVHLHAKRLICPDPDNENKIIEIECPSAFSL